MASTQTGDTAPHGPLAWFVDGGLVGGYLGARVQPRLLEMALRLLLGLVAIALTVTYLIQRVG